MQIILMLIVQSELRV